MFLRELLRDQQLRFTFQRYLAHLAIFCQVCVGLHDALIELLPGIGLYQRCQIAHVHKAANLVIVKDIDDPYLHRLLLVLILLVRISLADGIYLLKFHDDAWLAYIL